MTYKLIQCNKIIQINALLLNLNKSAKLRILCSLNFIELYPAKIKFDKVRRISGKIKFDKFELHNYEWTGCRY